MISRPCANSRQARKPSEIVSLVKAETETRAGQNPAFAYRLAGRLSVDADLTLFGNGPDRGIRKRQSREAIGAGRGDRRAFLDG